MQKTLDQTVKNKQEETFHQRRQFVFILLSGIFLGTLGMLNILGISRFVNLSFELFGYEVPLIIAIGVLPYPITFLCTDFISEFYGKKRANQLVLSGLLVNIWLVFILWLGGALPGFEAIDPSTGEIAKDTAGRLPVFFEIRSLALGAVLASMIAYLTAQFCDVYFFHFFKNLTKGKHLWLRNNGSTLVSQLIDTTAVILITHYVAHALPINEQAPLAPQLFTFIASGYLFKMLCALFDTIPFYIGHHYLSRYLGISSST